MKGSSTIWNEINLLIVINNKLPLWLKLEVQETLLSIILHPKGHYHARCWNGCRDLIYLTLSRTIARIWVMDFLLPKLYQGTNLEEYPCTLSRILKIRREGITTGDNCNSSSRSIHWDKCILLLKNMAVSWFRKIISQNSSINLYVDCTLFALREIFLKMHLYLMCLPHRPIILILLLPICWKKMDFKNWRTQISLEIVDRNQFRIKVEYKTNLLKECPQER